MTPGLRKKLEGFIKRHPQMSPPLMRFPVPDTFWNAGMHRILLRLANYYINCAQMAAKKNRAIGYPSHLFVDPTNACNLRCPLCPTGAGVSGRPRGMMPLQMFKKIIDDIGRYLVSVDLFNWGEPLLNKDIHEMISYAHKAGIVTSVSTNMNYFSEASAEDLISSGLDILILSIDGASQESYEKYRVGGDLSKVLNNIRLMTNKKKSLGIKHPYICWQFLLMKHNEHETDKAREMAEEFGVDRITFDHAYLPVGTRHEALQWLPSDPKNHRYNLSELNRVWDIQENPQKPSHSTAVESPEQEVFHRRPNCLWLWTQSAINYDGSVSPCCAIYDPSTDFGYLAETSFSRIWNNKKYRASRHFSSTGKVADTVTICMKCPLSENG